MTHQNLWLTIIYLATNSKFIINFYLLLYFLHNGIRIIYSRFDYNVIYVKINKTCIYINNEFNFSPLKSEGYNCHNLKTDMITLNLKFNKDKST